MKIGVFGGSFNPVHIGHLLAARCVMEKIGLEKILWIPCYQSADSHKMVLADGRTRLRLLKKALKKHADMEVLDLELKRGGVSRTVDTLQELKLRFPDDILYLLLGNDQFSRFSGWRQPENICKLAKLVVMSRPDSPETALDSAVWKKYQALRLEIPMMDISSSRIRRRLQKNLPVTWMLPSVIEQEVFRIYKKA